MNGLFSHQGHFKGGRLLILTWFNVLAIPIVSKRGLILYLILIADLNDQTGLGIDGSGWHASAAMFASGVGACARRSVTWSGIGRVAFRLEKNESNLRRKVRIWGSISFRRGFGIIVRRPTQKYLRRNTLAVFQEWPIQKCHLGIPRRSGADQSLVAEAI